MNFQLLAAQLRQPHGDMGKKVGESMNASNELINNQAIAAVNIKPNDTILEIGMGNGFFCKDVLQAANGVMYMGCDFSELMVAEASQLNEHFIDSKQATFILGNAEQLPFEASYFHNVFTVNTIYFWEDPNKVMTEIHRVLKPAGKLVVGLRTRASMQHLPFTQYGFTSYDEKELHTLLTRNNFTNIQIQQFDEPEGNFNGQVMKIENLIVSGEKL